MKSAQELRVDEISIQKLRENHQTIQKLTSQLQEMQEQMNSMSDSGEFQEVESKSGRLFHVPKQTALIPSSRSMLSRDRRLPFDTWKYIWITRILIRKSISLQLIRLEIIIKEFTIVRHQERQDQFHKRLG